jgi:hypothetical protein
VFSACGTTSTATNLVKLGSVASTDFSLTAGTTALAASTNYCWSWIVVGVV